MAGSRDTHWYDAPVSRVTEDSSSEISERVRARLEGWDTDALVWRRVKVNSSGELLATLDASSVHIGTVDQGAAGAAAWKVDGSGVTQPVSIAAAVDVSDRSGRLLGHVTVDNASLAVTGAFFQATQPVSAASLPLPTGAAKDSTLTDSSLRVGGTVAVSGGASVFHIDDNAGSLTVDNGGTFPVQATLAAETTKVIGTVNQGTSPWVTSRNWTLGSGTDSVAAIQSGAWTDDVTDRAARLLGHVTVDASSGQAADAASALPGASNVIAGWDGFNIRTITVRTKDGVNMLQTSDQQVRQYLELLYVETLEQTSILRQLVGERADLN